jgi:hypothetical protein
MKESGNPNRLISESSPYLLQHAYNPVDWYPWGDEALSTCQGTGQTHSRFNRLFILPLVPCHGKGIV